MICLSICLADSWNFPGVPLSDSQNKQAPWWCPCVVRRKQPATASCCLTPAPGMEVMADVAWGFHRLGFSVTEHGLAWVGGRGYCFPR